MSDSAETGKSIIKPLPPNLANKIAAGEVIQRPASVVKELLDNAVDSGADVIKVVVQNAGRTLIQVVDNGCGMGREDLKPCFLQHATSKIQEIDDLHKIRTFGFRGEAMASIASISQVEVVSRRHEDDSAYKIEIEGGETKTVEPAAGDPGTSVSVRNLFFNVPARRQFLKTDATEFRHILKEIQSIAISKPEIAFEVIADTDQIYRLPPANLEKRVVEIFGTQYRSSLIPFKEETSYVKIHGLLSDPKTAKKSRGTQFIFVNDRPVQHRGLIHVTLNTYDNWLQDREYPFFALFLTLNPENVDVNVHPAKREVKFEDERSIVQLTKSVVKKALNQYMMVPSLDSREGAGRESIDPSFQSMQHFKVEEGSEDDSSVNVQLPSRINFEAGMFDGKEIGELLYEEQKQADQERSGQNTVYSRQTGQGFWQLHERYILTQTRTGLCVIDQYRAHMRIIYEKTISATEEDLPGTQQLLFAQTADFSATDFALLKELLPIVQRMGFSIQLLSGHSAIINGVPADIDIGDEQSVLRQMLQEYREMEGKLKLDSREKIAVAFASKTAIPGGKKLSSIEMETLIDQLFACDKPYIDPLKRPALVYIPMNEIENRFR